MFIGRHTVPKVPNITKAQYAIMRKLINVTANLIVTSNQLACVTANLTKLVLTLVMTKLVVTVFTTKLVEMAYI